MHLAYHVLGKNTLAERAGTRSPPSKYEVNARRKTRDWHGGIFPSPYLATWFCQLPPCPTFACSACLHGTAKHLPLGMSCVRSTCRHPRNLKMPHSQGKSNRIHPCLIPGDPTRPPRLQAHEPAHHVVGHCTLIPFPARRGDPEHVCHGAGHLPERSLHDSLLLLDPLVSVVSGGCLPSGIRPFRPQVFFNANSLSIFLTGFSSFGVTFRSEIGGLSMLRLMLERMAYYLCADRGCVLETYTLML